MRLSHRRVRLWNESYLAYRSMWSNIEDAVREARYTGTTTPQVVLDIGCGHKPYADLFENCLHVGLNPVLDDASPDLLGDAMALPIGGGHVDIVFCTQVLEHVPRPQALVQECARVLRPGGHLVLSAPFYWPLHEEPHDFFRYTPHGLRMLVEGAGLQLVWLRADGGDGSRLMTAVLHALPRWAALMARLPCNVAGIALDRVGGPPLLPLNYTLLARAPSKETLHG